MYEWKEYARVRLLEEVLLGALRVQSGCLQPCLCVVDLGFRVNIQDFKPGAKESMVPAPLVGSSRRG